MTDFQTDDLPKIGISACLLGEKVRYDGRDKKNFLIVSQLNKTAALVPFCPEVAIGLGIPRPPIHLLVDKENIYARQIENASIDVTAALRQYVKKVHDQLSTLSGFILQSRSPSCGIHNVKVMQHDGHYELNGRGIFADELIKCFPSLPVIEEQELNNTNQCKQFLQDAIVYKSTQNDSLL